MGAQKLLNSGDRDMRADLCRLAVIVNRIHVTAIDESVRRSGTVIVYEEELKGSYISIFESDVNTRSLDNRIAMKNMLADRGFLINKILGYCGCCHSVPVVFKRRIFQSRFNRTMYDDMYVIRCDCTRMTNDELPDLLDDWLFHTMF